MIRALGAALLGALMSVAASGFDEPSLYVPGIALLILGLGSWLWVQAASQGAALIRIPGPPTVEEESPYPIRLILERGMVRAPGGELDEPMIGAPVRLTRTSPRRIRVDVRFARRGRRGLEGARLTIRDPLGLAVREMVSAPAEVLVLPRVEKLGLEAAGVTTGLGREASRLSAHAAELELDSLRPYREGAPASRIHWPTVARRGEMVERRLIADVDLRPLVVVDPRRPPSEEALDQALRAAASLCVHLAAASGCSLLLPGDRRANDIDSDLRAWAPLHARLALVEAEDGAPVAGRIERAGAVFWVAAGASGPPPGIARAAAALRYLVTPGTVPGQRPEFTVAGCGVHRLGRRGSGRAAA
ncbi:MAG: hypothetical protein QOC95_548 [Thermoleophilaceae bacterium]|nr:hypothetical protein [Thermoleophilaceae bacterium]